MAINEKKLNVLVIEKLKLMEQWVGFQTNLALKYGWKCSREDTETLRRLADKIDNVTIQIKMELKG
jgi:hypothetical protein